MARHRASSKDSVAGGLLLGVVASGTLAAATLNGAGSANATCASIGGVSSGTGCTSTATSFAVGLGSGTTASATGLFSGAIANGVTNTGTQVTDAEASGPFDFAYAGGPNTFASARGTLGVAVAQGKNVFATAGASSTDVGNAAFNIANEPVLGGNFVVAGGGNGNLATTVGGTGNGVFAGYVGSPSTLSTAFAIGGTNNAVIATPGPFNVAGLVNQTSKGVLNNIH
jgi:hypothetical protein